MATTKNIEILSKDGKHLGRMYDQPVRAMKGRKDGPWFKVRYMGRDYRLTERINEATNTTHILRLGTALPSTRYQPEAP